MFNDIFSELHLNLSDMLFIVCFPVLLVLFASLETRELATKELKRWWNCVRTNV